MIQTVLDWNPQKPASEKLEQLGWLTDPDKIIWQQYWICQAQSNILWSDYLICQISVNSTPNKLWNILISISENSDGYFLTVSSVILCPNQLLLVNYRENN